MVWAIFLFMPWIIMRQDKQSASTGHTEKFIKRPEHWNWHLRQSNLSTTQWHV